MENVKVGFIGFGNMARAIATGWIHYKVLSPDLIYAYDPNTKSLQAAADKLGIQPARNNLDLVGRVDVVIIAVKPDMLSAALDPRVAQACQGKMVISLAVNNFFEQIEALLPKSRHVTILPNLPIELGQGIVVVEEHANLTPDQWSLFDRLFKPVSFVLFLPKSKFGIAGIITSCGPAFVALFAEALSDGGVEYGLNRSLSYELAAKMIEGSAALISDKKLLPTVLKDMVCSPAGTTIQGVNTLRKNGFQGDVIEAMEAIQNFSSKK